MIFKREILTGSMKVADLPDIDFNLLGVLPRVGIGFGFGDSSVEEACKAAGIDTDTFLLICSVYTEEGFIPTAEMLEKVCIKDIVRYLKGSHSYYTGVLMKDLEKSLDEILVPCGDLIKKVIWKFFSEYRSELSRHFEYEESVVFPYVGSVLAHAAGEGFKIIQYEENHTNVEEKLEDLKNIVMKYLPHECDNNLVASVLLKLYLLGYDLGKHTEIEDGILVPAVNRLEGDEQ